MLQDAVQQLPWRIGDGVSPRYRSRCRGGGAFGIVSGGEIPSAARCSIGGLAVVSGGFRQCLGIVGFGFEGFGEFGMLALAADVGAAG